jgi:alpha-D-ribose 1-methylphosphonate 5-triphosphate diphosphatase
VDGLIREIAAGADPEAEIWDLDGMLLMPGLVDLHGDAFERQVMPRPKVNFPMDMALIDTDRQLIANGITTAFYGLTYSWEPGLRGRDAAFVFIEAMARLKPQMLCDGRVHLRQEVHNVAGEADVLGWLSQGKIDLLAFNDHLWMIKRDVQNPEKLGAYAGRAGIPPAAFLELVQAIDAKGNAVPGSIERLAAAARKAGVAMASHDDDTPAKHDGYADLGCRLCEFPLNRETADTARARGNAVIMGAPNVVRGGSHTNGLSASAMIRDGMCAVLTSDYYYPSMLHAAFRLANDGICSLAEAWNLISAKPAEMVGLSDRGMIAEGKRADLVAIDAGGGSPRIAGVFAKGAPVLLADRRLRPSR